VGWRLDGPESCVRPSRWAAGGNCQLSSQVSAVIVTAQQARKQVESNGSVGGSR
jgi:hypothetical protein